ncbi:MAG: glycosyltransferase family 39 protein [Caldilineaceae bacterium]
MNQFVYNPMTLPTQTRTTRMRWWEWLLLLALLGLFAGQDLAASPHKSAAFDEQYHLTAGYAYLRTGDFRLATTHPPLMGMIAGAALLGRSDITLPTDQPAWAAADRFLFSDLFLWEANGNGPALVEAARRPIIGVGLLLLVGLFCWSRQLLGAAASWFVLLLATFDPNLLANARVITTDLGLTCFLTLALWWLWAWLEVRSWRNLLLTGLCAGLAMGAKYTGLFFWPAALLILALYPRQRGQDGIVRRLGGLVLMGVAAYATLWAIFRFTVGPIPNLAALNWPGIQWLRDVPVPAPFYWQQLLNTFLRIVNLQGARLDFLLGEPSNQGWWYYFPVALAVKTPLPLLIMASGGAWLMLRRGQWRRLSVLWVLPLLFLGLGLSGILTIGYRHILPAVPLLILLAAQSIVRLPKPGRSHLLYWGAQGALLLWLVVGTVRLWPDQEAFFNGLAGDWRNWSNILVDSNLDWGQDLPALRQTMTDLSISTVNLAYFGKAVPEAYGVTYRPLPSYLRFVEGVELSAYNPYTPEPGWYAISATSLRLGLMQPESVDLYAYFRQLEPMARAGYSIYLYHVTYPAGMPVDRIQVVGEPLFRLPPDALGVQPERRLQVKWVRDAAAATIYPLDSAEAQNGVDAQWTPPDLADDLVFEPVNADFSQVFTLLGYSRPVATSHPGGAMPLTLYWQVGTHLMPMPAPTKGAPLSAFVQLTTEDPGAKVAQYDGWATALRGLEVGDIIVQPVTLEIAETAAPGDYHLRIGLYSPQNWERLAVQSGAGESDHADVGAVRIE